MIKEEKTLSMKQLIKIVNYISDKVDLVNNLKLNSKFEFDIKSINKKINIDFSKVVRISRDNLGTQNMLKVWGQIRKINENEYEILYSNQIKYFSKQLFTISHQYIHFIIDEILSTGIEIEGVNFLPLNVDKSHNRSYDMYEHIIERLASKLIVSDKKFNKYVKNKDLSIEFIINLSNKFNLSLSAAEIRFEESV